MPAISKILLLLLFVCFPIVLFSRDPGATSSDSLLRKLALAKEDTQKVQLLNIIARTYYDVDPNQGLKYARQALSLAEHLGSQTGIASSDLRMGGLNSLKGNTADAIRYVSDALKIYETLGMKTGVADCHITISAILYQVDNYPEALKNVLDALKIYQEIGDKYGVASSYGNLGNMYAAVNNSSEAKKYYLLSFKALDELGYKPDAAAVLLNLATIYFDQGDYNESLKMSLDALHRIEALGDKSRLPAIYQNIGDIYSTQENYEKSIENYEMALKISTELGTELDEGAAISGIAGVYFKQKKYDEAEKYLIRQLEFGKKTGSLLLLKEGNNMLSTIAEKKGDLKRALEYYKAFVAARDSVFNEENTKKTVQVQMQYEFDKKEALGKMGQAKKDGEQKLLLERKNIMIYGTMSALAALMFIGGLLMRQSKLKSAQQRIELEQKQLRAQMNPHFIFNCLNSIQHFVVANDVKNANKYLTGFASLMRQTLENSKDGTITLRKELAYLENYLTLELMRFEDKFTYEIVLDTELKIDSVEIQSMIIQPFIENAIRHGLCYLKDRKGKLTVRFYMKEAHLFCEIDDNGIGREQSQKLKIASDTVYESQGMELTRQRLSLVSRTNGSDYQIAITDKRNTAGLPEGTTILIKFPTEI